MIFEELPFCHFPRLNTSILGKDSQIELIFHFNILFFFKKRKTTILFPSPLTFLQLPINMASSVTSLSSESDVEGQAVNFALQVIERDLKDCHCREKGCSGGAANRFR